MQPVIAQRQGAAPRWIWPAALALLVLAVVVAIRFLNPPHTWTGMFMEPPMPVNDFSLTAAGDKPVHISDFRGKLVALYFGYTYCPDVCPTTLAELAAAMHDLGAEAKQVQVVFVSVDPDRDTPARLAEYVANFDPSFIGITGTPAEIAAAATPLGIYYKAHEGTAATGYLIDHTATVLVLDRQGSIRLLVPFGATGAEIAGDLHALLRMN